MLHSRLMSNSMGLLSNGLPPRTRGKRVTSDDPKVQSLEVPKVQKSQSPDVQQIQGSGVHKPNRKYLNRVSWCSSAYRWNLSFFNLGSSDMRPEAKSVKHDSSNKHLKRPPQDSKQSKEKQDSKPFNNEHQLKET